MADVLTPLDVMFAGENPQVKQASQQSPEAVQESLAALTAVTVTRAPITAGFISRCQMSGLDKQATAQLLTEALRRDEYLRRDWENGCAALNG